MVWEKTDELLTGGNLTTISLDFANYKYRIYNPNNIQVDINVGTSNSIGVYAYDYFAIVQNQSGFAVGWNDLRLLTTVPASVVIQRESKNTAPTQPGAFTQPTGELEIGDTRTISWGSALTGTSTIKHYRLQMAVDAGIDGNAYSDVQPFEFSTSKSITVPAVNRIKFRVLAVDLNNLESPYRESQTYTVTKPKYYWSKYNATNIYAEIPFPTSGTPGSFMPNSGSMSGYSSYEYDPTTGEYRGLTYDYLQYGSSPGKILYQITLRGQNIITEKGTRIIKYTMTDETGYVKVEKETPTTPTGYGRGSLIQSGLIAEEGTYPIDGRHTDGFWYVRGSRVNQSIPPTGAFSAPTPTAVLKPGQGVAVTFTASTAPNISLYELEYRYNSGLWTTLGTNNTALTRSFTPTTDKTLTNVQFRVRAKNTSNVYSDYVYSETFNIEHNAKPTLTLTTANNLILAETNTIVIAGQALDTDTGNVVNVYYQINTGNNVAIATGISNGTAPLPFSKTLTFKEGKLLDGTTVIASNLVETQTYTLKVWSEDNQGGKSDVQTRSFKVIPNRAPLLTVAAITQKTGLINNDAIAITGTVTDPENQTVKVKYKINGGALVQGYSGAGGNFSFNIKTGDLLTGDNTIELQASDTYDLITTKKYRFTKVKNTTNLLTSVVRYKVTVPVVGTTGIVTWIERDNGDLTVTPALSMRMTGETESYTAMEQQVTAPVNGSVTEDQYRLTPASAKTDVTFKLTLTKTAAGSDKGVKKITGALQ